MKEKNKNIGLALDVQSNGGPQFVNNEVVADRFLSYVKNLASKSARIQQDFENLFLWRCKMLLQYIIFLTKDDLEKLQIHLELQRIQCH